MSTYVYIWQYLVNPKYLKEFNEFYGPLGIWNQFFKLSVSYIKTEILVDTANKFKFITIDYWHSKVDYNDFITINEKKYFEIDQKCDKFTLEELKIGEFYIEH